MRARPTACTGSCAGLAAVCTSACMSRSPRKALRFCRSGRRSVGQPTALHLRCRIDAHLHSGRRHGRHCDCLTANDLGERLDLATIGVERCFALGHVRHCGMAVLEDEPSVLGDNLIPMAWSQTKAVSTFCFNPSAALMAASKASTDAMVGDVLTGQPEFGPQVDIGFRILGRRCHGLSVAEAELLVGLLHEGRIDPCLQGAWRDVGIFRQDRMVRRERLDPAALKRQVRLQAVFALV